MNPNKKTSTQKQMDTIIRFSQFIELKKDSISKLSTEEQTKIKQLEKFSLSLKNDTLSHQFEMKMSYEFDNCAELELFGEKLKDQNIKELSGFSKKMQKPKKENNNDYVDFNKGFKTVFNRKKISHKITNEALQKAIKNKDTTLTKDNPMATMVKFKTRFLFPYRIKNTNHTRIINKAA